MDHYADDLAELVEAFDLNEMAKFGFSTGGGEVARYVGRHGTGRVARLGLNSAVKPLMLRTKVNPSGLPISAAAALALSSTSGAELLVFDLA